VAILGLILDIGLLETIAKVVKTHEATVLLLSFFISGFTAFAMWSAHRRIKSEKWMKYFAWSFGLLSAQYLVRILMRFYTMHPGRSANAFMGQPVYIFFAIQMFSIANNLFAVAAARDLENEKKLLPIWCQFLAAGSLVTTLVGYALSVRYPDQPFYTFLGRSFDSIFSAYAVYLIGYATFANLSFRRHFPVALSGVVIGLFYSSVQVTHGLGPLVAVGIVGKEYKESLVLLDSFLIAIALPLKLILCLCAYLLVMRFFEALNDLTGLQDRGIAGRQDYLSSDGLVKLIGEKLIMTSAARQKELVGESDGSEGFINLTIKLPGEKNKRIACILWPYGNPDNRAEVLDWDGKARFFRPSNNPAAEKGVKANWEKALRFVGEVLTDQNKRLNVWPNANPRLGSEQPDEPKMRAIVSVAIETHGAAIGCLQVSRSHSVFSQMAIRQIREIANLVSPAVQAYRELAALDQISIRFAEKQAEEFTYSRNESAALVADILYNVFSPLVMRLKLDFGFTTIERINRGAERIAQDMEVQVALKEWDKIPSEFVGQDIIIYRLLRKQLTARVQETINANDLNDPNRDRFIVGHMILVVSAINDTYNHPTMGTNYLLRKTASTLAADAFLDFAWEFHSDLLKGLGKELSQRQLDMEEAFEIVKTTVAAAGLAWIIGIQRGRQGRLGDAEGLSTGVAILKNLAQLAIRQVKFFAGEIEITHYTLKSRQANSSHALKLQLPSSGGFIWLGVERPGFGPELEFSSPWRTFLVNFAQIVDAAFLRITFQPVLVAAQVQGVAAAVMTTGTMLHQISNLVQGQSSSISTLIDALRVKQLITKDENIERIMYAMKGSAENMQELFQSLTRLTKTDAHRPCQLKEAGQNAVKLFEVASLQRRITFEINIPEDLHVDVPFNVAALALANLVGNAKDAVQRDGKVRIEAKANEEFVYCHVIDNGSGVPPDIQKRLFELGITSKKTGSGLGLYLTRHALNENRSSVELTKTDERGTIFTIRFPMPKMEGV
jgi:signal transduction histidine kinase